MADMTDRKELRRLMARAISNSTIASVRSIRSTDRVLDDLDAAGLAVVPRVPTKEMEAAAKDYRGSFHKWIHMVRVSNLLKEK